MKKVLDVLDKLFHYLAAIGFGCVTVCVLVQILARYIPGVTAPWTDEMTRLFFQYTIMIACPMAIKYHEYASIDVIEYREGDMTQTPLKIPGLKKYGNITL